MIKVLLAGFENDPEQGRNMAWDFISKASEHSNDDRFVQAVQLPLSWDKSFHALLPTILQGWHVALIFGGTSNASIAVERLALNESDVSLKDAAGRRPESKTIIAGDEPGYWTGIPYREITINLTNAGIPSTASHHAGGFVENQVFYRMMHWIQRDHPSMMGGLIRIPQNFDLSVDEKSLALSCILDTLSGCQDETEMLGFDVAKLRGVPH